MRHGKSFNHLSRKSAHRKALLANLASSLIMHKRIKTTTAKAKALRTFVEPIITRSKEDSTHSRRLAFSYLGNKNAVSELFREVSSKIGDRPGGYTRIMKIDNRAGDSADMCIIELVDYNENLLGEKEASKAKTGRKRRSKKKPGEVRAEGETVAQTAEHEVGTDEAKETTAEGIADSDKGVSESESRKTKAGSSKATHGKAKASKPVADKTEGEDSSEIKETKEAKEN
jgi:large subunit ribosomal protein L17